MLLFLCSFAADSMSRSTSFWPSTIATRSSSACVALKSMRFINLFSRARGQDKPRAWLFRLASHYQSLDHVNAVIWLVGSSRCGAGPGKICRYAVGALFNYYHWLDNQTAFAGFGFMRSPIWTLPLVAVEPGTR